MHMIQTVFPHIEVHVHTLVNAKKKDYLEIKKKTLGSSFCNVKGSVPHQIFVYRGNKQFRS